MEVGDGVTAPSIEHSHRWRIDEVNGRRMVGAVCQICDATNEYPAWLDEEFAVKGSRRKERAS